MAADQRREDPPRSAPTGLVDRFLSPELLAGPSDLLRRARLAIAFAWVSAGFFLVSAASQFRADNRGAALFDAFGALVTLASPVLVRRTGQVVVITHAVLALVYGAVFALSLLVRGAGLTGATLMLAVIPLFATLILGGRAGVAWLVLSLMGGVGLGVLGWTGLIVDHLTAPVRLVNDHFVLAVFTVLLFAVATVFENRKDEALRQIQQLEEQRRLAELGEVHAQAAAQLAQAEQFASLGRIAAAAAHEINNPLAYIISNLQFVAKSGKSGDLEVAEALTDALEGARRIDRIVSDMNAVARPAEALSAVVVADAMALATRLAARQLEPKARVRTTVAQVPAVAANEAKLTQVFLDLLLDAAQALPEGRAAENEIAVAISGADGLVSIEIRTPAARHGDGASLSVTLGEAVIRSFGGSLVLARDEAGAVARLTLPAAVPRTA